jgi:hypothetical protein
LNLLGFNDWTRGHPYVLVLSIAAVAALALALRRVRGALASTPAAVVVAAFGAVVCTAYSADTSWRFARDHLGMASAAERSVMFCAAELALFSMALMARQNLRTQGAPGAPGLLVWVITAVQVIPAYSESGVIAGTVRAFVGPVLAALLWHLAMGIELRHAKPGADSQSLPALVARELRERLLSRLGLARRGRDAAQISRDRWTGIATRRAAHLAVLQMAGARSWRIVRARRRLASAVDHTDAGVLADQRQVLLERLAAYRSAAELATVPLPSPWRTGAVEEPEATIPMTTATAPARRPRPPYLRHRRGRVLRRPDYRQVAEPEALDSVRESSGQAVTDPVIITPADLRRQAARFNKEMVSQTGRPVTIDQLRRALSVSRREATKLRREVVTAGRS